MTDLRRRFAKGTRVEICPFASGNSHHYLAHMDGEKGVVEGLQGHGYGLKVLIVIDGSLGAIDFPARAVKPARKGE